MTTCLLRETSGLHAPFLLIQRTNESLQLGMCYGIADRSHTQPSL